MRCLDPCECGPAGDGWLPGDTVGSEQKPVR